MNHEQNVCTVEEPKKSKPQKTEQELSAELKWILPEYGFLKLDIKHLWSTNFRVNCWGSHPAKIIKSYFCTYENGKWTTCDD